MRSYSPYDNVKAQAYPTMLVRTSYNDSQGHVLGAGEAGGTAPGGEDRPQHSALQGQLEPAGHGGASGRYDQLRDEAFDQAFILTQLGVTSSTPQAAA
jgi:oligopeptidase B